ncbi:MAG TPA: DUF5320 family protein [Vicinamibacteria bacterium]|nr:DUF5320 family protein [Vicinamibacteria bacterium]
MPRGDRTGPEGLEVPGSVTAGRFGRGAGGAACGGRRRFRRAFRAGWWPGWLRFDGWTAWAGKQREALERETLESQARDLEASLERIRWRLGEIGKDGSPPSR